jgi:hypothetical protein
MSARRIPCTSEQPVCGICGKEKQVIGYEASEVLDVEPAKYFVQVTKRENPSLRKGREEGGVSCAPLPDRIIEKGLGSDGVVMRPFPPKDTQQGEERETDGSRVVCVGSSLLLWLRQTEWMAILLKSSKQFIFFTFRKQHRVPCN